MAINFEGFSAFARSTLAALQLSQNGTGVNDGSIPDVVPFVRYGSRPGDVSWSAVMPALVWALYQQRGDLDTAAEYFDALVALQRNVSQSAFDDGNLNVLEDTFGEYGGKLPADLPNKRGHQMLFTDVGVVTHVSSLAAFPLLSRRRRRTYRRRLVSTAAAMWHDGWPGLQTFARVHLSVQPRKHDAADRGARESSRARRRELLGKGSRRFAGVLRYGVAPCGQ